MKVFGCRTREELQLRFHFCRKFGFFLGRTSWFHSPMARTVKQLASFLKHMAPLWDCSCNSWGRGSIVWRRSPVELQELWEHFHDAVREMYESIGEGRSEGPLKRLCLLYHSNGHLREQHLRYWEQQHMAVHDKNLHRPYRLREHVRDRPAQRAGNDARRFSLLRKLLEKWSQIIAKEKLKRERERQKAERLRREALRKRMRDPNLTMDDLLGILEG